RTIARSTGATMSEPNANLIFDRPIVTGSGAARNENCSVELLGLAIYGDYRHGYQLPCLDEAAQAAVVRVNDLLSDEAKQTRRWRLLVARLGLCHAHGNDRLSLRMALWAARSVEHLADDPRVKACNDTFERWLAGDATDDELAAAGAAAEAAAGAEAAWSVGGGGEAAAGGGAGGAGAGAAGVDRDDALMEWLDAYLTAWHKTACDEGEAI